MGAFNHPAACLFAGVTSLFVQLLAAGLYIQLIVARLTGGQCRKSDVGCIGAERSDLPAGRIRPGIDDGPQSGAWQAAVMPVCPAGDEQQRDSTRVGQEAALAPIFSLDPWSWVPRIRLPAAPFP